MYDQLSNLSGSQFDKKFAQEMVSDHKKDISKYEKEAKSKGPLADFAQETVPTLQEALQSVCDTLSLKVVDDAATRLVARKIIELTQGGVRDAAMLRAMTLNYPAARRCGYCCWTSLS